MNWVIAVWDNMTVVIYSSEHHSLEHVPNAVLYVSTPDSGRVSGHDHYWINFDGTVGTASHHDYDAAAEQDVPWQEAGKKEPDLPSDRKIFDGVMAPDWVAKELNL